MNKLGIGFLNSDLESYFYFGNTASHSFLELTCSLVLNSLNVCRTVSFNLEKQELRGD